jgi:hypothetical protein
MFLKMQEIHFLHLLINEIAVAVRRPGRRQWNQRHCTSSLCSIESTTLDMGVYAQAGLDG